MSIAEKIYELRTEKRLSQSELAELLEVSRQSVSKWETGSAVPDLDKLMKLCDVFEISLDELTGRERKESAKKESSLPWNKIIGCIFLTISLISGLLACLSTNEYNRIEIIIFVTLPFLISSLILLLIKRNTGYWCGVWNAFYYIWFILFNFPIARTFIVVIAYVAFVIVITILAQKLYKGKETSKEKKRRIPVRLRMIGLIIFRIIVWGLFFGSVVPAGTFFLLDLSVYICTLFFIKNYVPHSQT